MRTALIPVFCVLLLGSAPATPTVSVAYAGSLATTMQGPLAAALLRDRHIRFEGEPKGSTALAHLIAGGFLVPDVFISADPKFMRALQQRQNGARVAVFHVFGSARLVLGYSPRSRYVAEFRQAAARRRSVWSLLADPRLRLGRTDPAIDPKGVRTLESLGIMSRAARSDGRPILQRAAVFPEETLELRLETGDLDGAFFYSTETAVRGIPAIELPGGASLAGKIRYAIAVLRAAPHPQAARAFEAYVLRGPGRAILTRAGVRYF